MLKVFTNYPPPGHDDPSIALHHQLQKDFLAALRSSEPDRFEQATSLLAQGADINGLHDGPGRWKGGNGPVLPRERITALYDAAERGDYEAVVFLLEKGADVMARNLTGATPWLVPFPRQAILTLRALDGMRTSREVRIVGLAEERFGVETVEEFVRRRDAFDTIPGYRVRKFKGGELVKPKIERVGSVLNAKKGGQKTRDGMEKSPVKPKIGKVEKGMRGKKSGQRRYELRTRNPNISYV